MHAYKISEIKNWWKEKDGKSLSVILSPYLNSAKNVSVGLVVISPGVNAGEHQHKEGTEEIWYIISGKGMVRMGKEEKKNRSGNGYLW